MVKSVAFKAKDCKALMIKEGKEKRRIDCVVENTPLDPSCLLCIVPNFWVRISFKVQ